MKEDNLKVYHNGSYVLIELMGSALELSRAEAEQLFVDLGHTLQDMDQTNIKEE